MECEQCDKYGKHVSLFAIESTIESMECLQGYIHISDVW